MKSSRNSARYSPLASPQDGDSRQHWAPNQGGGLRQAAARARSRPRRGVHDVGHRAGQVDLQHDWPPHRRQRQHRLAIGPSAHHLPVTLDGPPAPGEIGVIHRDLAQLVRAAQHDALHAHAKVATIVQPGARLGRRLRA